MGLPAAARDDFSTWSQRNASDALTAAREQQQPRNAAAASREEGWVLLLLLPLLLLFCVCVELCVVRCE